MNTYDYIPLYTYEDYEQWEGRWELIHGYPHAMSPSPNRKHQFIYTEIASEFRDILKNNKECQQCRTYQDLDWIISNNTTVCPDVMIVCGEFKDNFLKFPPSLIVEILSPRTTMKDYNIKYRLYESQKVKYYIIINPDTRGCDLFELENDVYVQKNNLKDFSFIADCNIAFDIPAFISQLILD